jgi:hypothetical protein
MYDSVATMPTRDREAAIAYAINLLNALLSHKTDSLFKYVLEASPYITDADAELLQVIERVSLTHEAQGRLLTRVVQDLDAVPLPVGHDIGIADINYLTLRYLLRYLIDYQEHCIDESEADLAYLCVSPAAAQAVEHIIETDRRDLEKLRSFLP